MNIFSSHQRQRGYLLEIPILFFILLVILAIILPHLRPLGQKILICIATVPILFMLYYMIVIPGWMPSDTARLRPPWNLLVFLLVAIVIITVVTMIVLSI
jgi:peptidoglycan/LPS O-acetylase OafA/YrhL